MKTLWGADYMDTLTGDFVMQADFKLSGDRVNFYVGGNNHSNNNGFSIFNRATTHSRYTNIGGFIRTAGELNFSTGGYGRTDDVRASNYSLTDYINTYGHTNANDNVNVAVRVNVAANTWDYWLNEVYLGTINLSDYGYDMNDSWFDPNVIYGNNQFSNLQIGTYAITTVPINQSNDNFQL